MAIVLPDGIYGNDNLSYIRKFLTDNGRLLSVIDVPIETFMPNTSTKTSIMIFQKLAKTKIPKEYPVYMAVAETCGHDRRGKENGEDDIAKIAKDFKDWQRKNKIIF